MSIVVNGSDNVDGISRWYAFNVKCECRDPKKQNLKVSGYDLFCKCCCRIAKITAIKDCPSIDSKKEKILKNEVDKLSTFNKDLRKELQDKSIELDGIKASYDGLMKEYSLMQDTYDSVCNRVMDCQRELELVKDEAEKKQSELEYALNSWQKSYKLLKEKYALLEQEIKETRSELSFAKTTNERLVSIDIRRLSEQFLDYMSGIYNATFDIADIDMLAQMIRARTDKVIMTSESCGLIIRRHERGSELGDGRMDIDIASTEVPDDDGRVAKCRTFGASFRNDAVADIPEKITVWKYVSPSDGSHAISEQIAGTGQRHT